MFVTAGDILKGYLSTMKAYQLFAIQKLIEKKWCLRLSSSLGLCNLLISVAKHTKCASVNCKSHISCRGTTEHFCQKQCTFIVTDEGRYTSSISTAVFGDNTASVDGTVSG